MLLVFRVFTFLSPLFLPLVIVVGKALLNAIGGSISTSIRNECEQFFMYYHFNFDAKIRLPFRNRQMDRKVFSRQMKSNETKMKSRLSRSFSFLFPIAPMIHLFKCARKNHFFCLCHGPLSWDHLDNNLFYFILFSFAPQPAAVRQAFVYWCTQRRDSVCDMNELTCT